MEHATTKTAAGSAAKRYVHRGEYHGPWQQIETRPCVGWRIIADELPNRDGWDVRAVHDGGTRVPMGINRHRNPAPEMQRLDVLLTGPLCRPVTDSQKDPELRAQVASVDGSIGEAPQSVTDARPTAGKAVEESSTGASRDEGATASPAVANKARFSAAAREIAAYEADIYKAKRNARVAKKQRGATKAQLAYRAKLFAPASPSIHDDIAALKAGSR